MKNTNMYLLIAGMLIVPALHSSDEEEMPKLNALTAAEKYEKQERIDVGRMSRRAEALKKEELRQKAREIALQQQAQCTSVAQQMLERKQRPSTAAPSASRSTAALPSAPETEERLAAIRANSILRNMNRSELSVVEESDSSSSD